MKIIVNETMQEYFATSPIFLLLFCDFAAEISLTAKSETLEVTIITKTVITETKILKKPFQIILEIKKLIQKISLD